MISSPAGSQRRRLSISMTGGAIASFGLDMFLVPNGLVVGGITGLSALASQITGLKTGWFLFLLNLPLFIFLYRHANRETATSAAAGLLVFCGCSILLHPLPALVEAGAAAAALGGIFLGLGIGLALRCGAVLDLFQLAKLPSSAAAFFSRLRITHTGILVNLLVLSLAGLILGWEQAMYSAVACLLALESARFAASGFSVTSEIVITSSKAVQIQEAVENLLGRTPEMMDAAAPDRQQGSGFSRIVYKVHVMEAARLKSIVRSMDPQASFTSSKVRTASSSSSDQQSSER